MTTSAVYIASVPQTQRYRVLGGSDVLEAPLDVARHIVAQCAEGPVTFRAMLETVRREVVEALAPEMPAHTADVSTRSEFAHPREVPIDDRDGVSLVFVEQRAVPGLLQLWLTLNPVDGGTGGISTLNMRLSRHDPLGPRAVVTRLQACRDAGVIPRDVDLDAALACALAPDVSPSKPGHAALGVGHLLGQSFYEGSSHVLVTLQIPVHEAAQSMLMADIWVDGAILDMRRYGTPEAALRAPNVSTYAIHTREDGPLTDALLDARTASDVLLVEWEIDDPSELRGVMVGSHETAMQVELDVLGNVDFEYGPDPLDLVEWVTQVAGVQLQHLHSG